MIVSSWLQLRTEVSHVTVMFDRCLHEEPFKSTFNLLFNMGLLFMVGATLFLVKDIDKATILYKMASAFNSMATPRGSPFLCNNRCRPFETKQGSPKSGVEEHR